MKVKIFKLGNEQTADIQLLKDMMTETFAPLMGEDGKIEEFASIKDATTAIGKAFSDSQTVIFTVDKNDYLPVKQTLMKAFGLSPETDATVLSYIEKARFHYAEVPNDEEQTALHALLPQNSKAFVTDTGLYTGFAATKGKQTIVVLPGILTDTAKLLYAQVIPFLNSLYSTKIETQYAEHLRVYQLKKSIENADTKIAVGHTLASALFMEYISSAKELTERIKEAPLSEARQDLDPQTYVVNQSIAAAEFLGMPYGVAVTNAFYIGTSADAEKTVFMAVTNREQTLVRKVKSHPGENTTDFMLRSMGELCLFVAEIMDADCGTTPETGLTDKKALKYKVLSVIVALLIAATVFFGAKYFKAHSYTFDMWLVNRMSLFEKDEADTDTNTVSTADDTRSITALAEGEPTSSGETDV